MKVHFALFLLSLGTVDAWTPTAARGASSAPDTFRRLAHRLGGSRSVSKARGSPLWATGYNNNNNRDDVPPSQKIRSSQRRVKELMDRSKLIKSQIEESDLQPSFVWLSEQLVSLTTHLRERYQEIRELAQRQGNYLSDQDMQTVVWLEDELTAVHAQLDGYGRIVAATLHETPDDYALQCELAELAELSQQIQLALGRAPDSDKAEMEQAYARTQTSLGRLHDLRQELANIESALDDMEKDNLSSNAQGWGSSDPATWQSQMTAVEANALPWENKSPWEVNVPEKSLVGAMSGTPSPSSRTRTSSTQLASQLNSSNFNDEQRLNGSGPSWLYEQRSDNVAAAADAGKSRWGTMENDKVQTGSSIGAYPESARLQQLAGEWQMSGEEQPVNPKFQPPLPQQVAPAQPPPPPEAFSNGYSLYDARTQKVASAAAAGRSRWGTMENRLAAVLTSQITNQPVEEVLPDALLDPPADTYLYNMRTEAVAAAAAAGKSRWGTMENQRATMMSEGTTTTDNKQVGLQPDRPTQLGPGIKNLYDQRIRSVAASARAGRSRWGTMENDRATTISDATSSPPTSSPGIVPGFGERTQQLAAQSGVADYVAPPRPAPAKVSRPTPPQPAAPSDADLYNQRREKVAASAIAGKSRWGTMETDKSKSGSSIGGSQSTMMPTDDSLYQKRNEQVAAAAAAGKSRWGDMENDKAKSMSPSSAPITGVASATQDMAPADTTLFDKRTEQVAASAAAGRSRWGSMENEKAKNDVGLKQAMETLANGIPDSTYTPPQDVVSQTPDASVRSLPADATLYDRRNAQIAAAAAEGMSRWGQMESEKATNAFGLKQAFETLGWVPEEYVQTRPPPVASAPAPVPAPLSPPPPPPQPQTASQPKGSVGSANYLELLAREWAAMSRSSDTKPAQPPPPQVASPVEPQVTSIPPPQPLAPSQPKGSSIQEDPMERLAREWAAMNRQEPDGSTQYQPPMQAPPPPPPVASASDPMADLARQWAALNSDTGSNGPPSSSFSASQPVNPEPPMASEPVVPPPAEIPNDWERLASEWMNMNRDPNQ